MKRITGAGVALITPFQENGSIDYTALERLLAFQIDQGMDYFVALGTTGETATLSSREKKELLKFIADKVAGRVPLVVGIGGNNTAQICGELQSMDLESYDAVLSVSPYYNKPTQEGIFQHYKQLAEASPLPLILYNVPARTGSKISAETTLRLAKAFPKIVAIKEASGDFSLFSILMRDKPEDFLLISGDDPNLLPMSALGASGVISVVGNAFPKELKQLCQSCLDGDYTTARRLHNVLLEMIDLCFIEGNPAGVKAALKHRNIISSDHVRLPLVGVSQAIYKRIQQVSDRITG